MARNLTLTRTEAEFLVDLLEACDPAKEGTWRHDMAADVRELFGMVTYEQEKAARAKENTAVTNFEGENLNQK